MSSEDEKKPLLTVSTKEPKDKKNVPTKSFILPLGLFLYSIASQLRGPAYSQYVYNYFKMEVETNNSHALKHSHIFVDNSTCVHTPKSESQKKVAEWNLYVGLSQHLVGLPMIIFAGIYSDFYGRKRFLLLSYVGATVETALHFCVIFFNLDIIYMLIPNILYGCTGTSYTFYLAAYTLIVDSTEGGKNRTFHMLLLHVYIGIGDSVSAIASGFIIQTYGFYIPMAAAFLFLCLGCFIVNLQPETLAKENRPKKPKCCSAFARFFIFIRGKGREEKTKRWKFMAVYTAFIVGMLSLTGKNSVESLYELGEPFCFSPKMVGYFGSSKTIGHMVAGSFLVKILHYCIKDEVIAILAVLSGVAYLVVLAFSYTDWMIFVASGCGILTGVPVSLMRSIMSKMALADCQGALFSMLYFVEVIIALIASPIFLPIYVQTQDIMEGMVFLIQAGLLLSTVFLLL
ncbi:hypothetical protein FSP39_020801 [Pinctada imbricata]|uniref:Proton-coupled folate transporter-like protein n=1 Tax=Pinctada imbricata TaxID=66713 RepID=A0AA88Y9C1_PINIB|nr:hypothetical protein FSP39_020801 [Pinctada imbricata]